MDITSIRLGRATNSSSAHSIILHPLHNRAVESQLPGDSIDVVNSSYGRNQFILRTAYDKAMYLLWSQRGTFIGASHHSTIQMQAYLNSIGLTTLLDDLQTFEPTMEMSEGYLRIPEGLDMTDTEWLAFMLSDAVTIVGYDDNSDPPYTQLVRDGVALDLSNVSHWKRDGDALIAYCENTGDKFRASATPYTKATTPELVDVKITDFCGYGCTFCYQGSTKAGQHAPLDRIEAIFEDLSGMGVFEIAIGGGEPAHHPQFADIIRAGSSRGLSVNFTAYGLDWTKNDAILDALRAQNRGTGVGISVHGEKDIVKITRAREAMRDARVYGVDIIAQTVIGATPTATIMSLIAECSKEQIPLLLLGYKETGRGASYQRKRISREEVRDILMSAQHETQKVGKYGNLTDFHLSVDTAFLDAWGDVLDELGIPTTLRTSPEGKFSMYVDAVEDTVGPSSYAGPDAMEPRGDIKVQFAAW